MRETDLETIEESLKVVIPQALRELLLVNLDNYPDFEIERFSGEKIIDTSRNFAADGFDGRNWLDHLLPIGCDANTGETYFVDLQDSKPWLYSACLDTEPKYDPEYYKKDCRFGLIL